MQNTFLNTSIKTALAGALAVCIGCAAAAGITTKTVNAEGYGADRKEAVNAALVEAVAKVRGLSIVNVSASAKASTSTGFNLGSKSIRMGAVSESNADATASETAGSVKSYEVISVTEENGRLHAKISADISVYKADQSNNRRSIAVVPFRIPEDAPAQYEKFQQFISQGAVDYVTSTRHFAVVDRSYEKERIFEFLRLLLPDVNRDERARIGNSTGTDYLVVGDIMNYQTRKTKTKVPYTNEILEKETTSATVAWRVLEAATGQILAAGTLKKDFNSIDPDIGRTIGEEIAEKIADIIYPIVALEFSNGRISLAQGGGSMKVGRVYTLNRYGKAQIDPYTREPMAREEIPVGKVRIVSVSPKISYAEVIDSRVDLSGMGPKEYVLRAIDDGMSGSSRGAAKPAVKTMTPAW